MSFQLEPISHDSLFFLYLFAGCRRDVSCAFALPCRNRGVVAPPLQMAARGGAARLIVEVQPPGGGTSRAALTALGAAVEAHAAAAGLPSLGAHARARSVRA